MTVDQVNVVRLPFALRILLGLALVFALAILVDEGLWFWIPIGLGWVFVFFKLGLLWSAKIARPVMFFSCRMICGRPQDHSLFRESLWNAFVSFTIYGQVVGGIAWFFAPGLIAGLTASIGAGIAVTCLVVVSGEFSDRGHSDAIRRNEQQIRQHYADWICPDCDKPFGEKVHYVLYGVDHEIDVRGRSFVRHVNLVCPRCRRLNIYDPQGKGLLEAGEPFDVSFLDDSELEGLKS